MIRLLLVEDHKKVRQALREGLEATGEVGVIAEVATAREAAAAVESVGNEAGGPEVALMDVELRDAELGASAQSGVEDGAAPWSEPKTGPSERCAEKIWCAGFESWPSPGILRLLAAELPA